MSHRTIDSLYEELVTEGILIKPKPVKMSDFIGKALDLFILTYCKAALWGKNIYCFSIQSLLMPVPCVDSAAFQIYSTCIVQ